MLLLENRIIGIVHFDDAIFAGFKRRTQK